MIYQLNPFVNYKSLFVMKPVEIENHSHVDEFHAIADGGCLTTAQHYTNFPPHNDITSTLNHLEQLTNICQYLFVVIHMQIRLYAACFV